MKHVKDIITITLITNIAIGILTVLFLGLYEREVAIGIYVALLMFGNLLFPIFIASSIFVLTYTYIINRVKKEEDNKLVRPATTVVFVLIVLALFGLWLWLDQDVFEYWIHLLLVVVLLPLAHYYFIRRKSVPKKIT